MPSACLWLNLFCFIWYVILFHLIACPLQLSSQRLSIGMTPKTLRLPKPGEMLLSVRGSPLGVYKEENMEVIKGMIWYMLKPFFIKMLRQGICLIQRVKWTSCRWRDIAFLDRELSSSSLTRFSFINCRIWGRLTRFKSVRNHA